MFLLSTIILLISAVFFGSLFRFRSRISYLLATYIFGFGSIALIGNIGHFFSLLGSQTYFLFSQLILLFILLFFWIRFDKPNLFYPFMNLRYLITKTNLKQFFKSNLDIILLFLGVSIGYVVLAIIWITVPPNNNDSLATHLSRVIYWIQHGNFLPWATPRVSQVVYPVNSGLQFLWTMLLTRSDKFVGLVQWSAAIISAVAIYGISGLLGAKFSGRLFAGLIFLTLPSVILQSTTPQNDLIAAALFGVSIYFLLKYLKEKINVNLILSAISLALLIGTKQTVLYLFPGLGIIFLVLWIYFRLIKPKEIIIFAVTVIITFLIIGSSIFFINLHYFGHPLGEKEVVSSSIQATSSIQTSVSQVSLNSLRFLYQFTDPTGLPSPLWRWGIKLRALVGENIFNFFKIPIETDLYTTFPHQFSLSKAYLFQEDEAWFGIIGFLILIPAFIYQSIVGFIKKDPIRISIFILSATFMVLLTLLRPGWDPYQGRYFLPIILLNTTYASKWLVKSFPWRLFISGVGITGLLILANGILYNPAKPIVDYPIKLFYRYPEDPGYNEIHHGKMISEFNHFEKVSLQTYSNYAKCEFVNNNIPENAIVGFATGKNHYQEYCFFGEKFSRTLIQIYPDDNIKDEDQLISMNIEYLILYKDDLFENIQFSKFFPIAESTDGNMLIYKLMK